MRPPAGGCIKYHGSINEKSAHPTCVEELVTRTQRRRCRNTGVWQESIVVWAMRVGYALNTWDTVPIKNFPVLSVKVLCGANTATVLPMMFHCDCIRNILEGSVKGV